MKDFTKEDILEILATQEDVLSPAIKEEQDKFKALTCVSCGASCRQTLNIKRPFIPGSPLPNKLLVCLECNAEFDPYTKLIVKAGSTLLHIPEPKFE